MEVLSPEKWKYYPRKNGSTIPGKIKIKKGKIGPALERSPSISARGRFFQEQYFQNALDFFFREQYFQNALAFFFREQYFQNALDFFFREQYFQNALDF